jgi:hypothetical protein
VKEGYQLDLTFGKETPRVVTTAKQTPSQSSPILHNGCGSQYVPVAHLPKLGPHFWGVVLVSGTVGIGMGVTGIGVDSGS